MIIIRTFFALINIYRVLQFVAGYGVKPFHISLHFNFLCCSSSKKDVFDNIFILRVLKIEKNVFVRERTM